MHLLQNFQIIKSTSWYLDGSLMTNPKQIIHENYHNNHLKTLFPSNLYLHLNISSLLHHIYDLKPLITNCHIKFINIINFINIYIAYHFLPFYPPLSWKTPKNKILKKWKKKCWRYHFTNVYQKPQSYDVQFLRYRAWKTEFFIILGHFLPF